MALPKKINLGSGKNFRAEYLNVDVNPLWKPDLIWDISRSIVLSRHTDRFGMIVIQQGWFEEILANDVLEHVWDIVNLMTNCLRLLRVGGRMEILVPYDLSLGAWSDPTHIHGFNQRSWLYYTDWFWYLNWTTHRFKMIDLQYGMEEGISFSPEIINVPRCVACMKVTLEKVALTEEEKETAGKYYARV